VSCVPPQFYPASGISILMFMRCDGLMYDTIALSYDSLKITLSTGHHCIK